MSNEVQFDEEQFTARRRLLLDVGKQEAALEKWLVKIGLATDTTQAKYILVVVVLICFAATIFVIIKSGLIPTVGTKGSPEQMMQDAQNMQNKFNTNNP